MEVEQEWDPNATYKPLLTKKRKRKQDDQKQTPIKPVQRHTKTVQKNRTT